MHCDSRFPNASATSFRCKDKSSKIYYGFCFLQRSTEDSNSNKQSTMQGSCWKQQVTTNPELAIVIKHKLKLNWIWGQHVLALRTCDLLHKISWQLLESKHAYAKWIIHGHCAVCRRQQDGDLSKPINWAGKCKNRNVRDENRVNGKASQLKTLKRQSLEPITSHGYYYKLFSDSGAKSKTCSSG